MPVLASSTGLTEEESVVNPPAHALVSALPHDLVQVNAVTIFYYLFFQYFLFFKYF
jgi:hypothetical protein